MAIDSASSTTALLAPGFRFHPTDEELVWYYLRRKICGKSFRFDAVSEIDIYKVEPWDLPGKSRLKTRDLEWYFFSVLDKKYGNGSRTNRATGRGYWKTTGKDRAVYHKSQTVGMKKTLVYHSGRAPRGDRTNWVMHEYRLVDEVLEKAVIVQDAFVLCRIYQKSGSGPKNGEQYGAPFIEEEWDDDEVVMFPKESAAEEVPDTYLDADDLVQILGGGTPAEDDPLPSNFCYGDNNSNCVKESRDFIEDAQKLLVGLGENHLMPEQPHDPKLFDLLGQHDTGAAEPVKHEYIGEPSNNVDLVDVDYLLDESFFDAIDNPLSEGRSFLKSEDLKNTLEADPSGYDMLSEYLTFCDAADDNLPYMDFDSSELMGSEGLVSDSTTLTREYVNEGTQQGTIASQHLFEGHNNDVATSSKQEHTKIGSDIQHPFVKRAASRMLGNIPAPPAFASEFPPKDVALRLNSASPSSSHPTHATAGMIQIRNVSWSGSGMDWSFGKHGHVNIILSLGLSQGVENSSAHSQPTPSKANLAIARSWLCSIFMWVLILSMSFKIGTFICAR